MKSYTALPSLKGQVTLPPAIRGKYNIGKNTPLVIQDKGKGVITIKVMKMAEPDDIDFREDKKGMSLHFKNGIDPKVILDAIEKIDG